MFPIKPSEDPQLDKAIDTLFEEMSFGTGETEKYAQIVSQLTKLYELKSTPQQISPDTALTVMCNLLGIALIVGYERSHIVTSKAVGFLLKLR
jgi:hypothetical protein